LWPKKREERGKKNEIYSTPLIGFIKRVKKEKKNKRKERRIRNRKVRSGVSFLSEAEAYI
jgi:hypothetical protein